MGPGGCQRDSEITTQYLPGRTWSHGPESRGRSPEPNSRARSSFCLGLQPKALGRRSDTVIDMSVSNKYSGGELFSFARVSLGAQRRLRVRLHRLAGQLQKKGRSSRLHINFKVTVDRLSSAICNRNVRIDEVPVLLILEALW